MKKFYSLIMLLFLALCLCACGSKGLKDVNEAYTYLDTTVKAYEASQNVSVVVSMKNGENVLKTELQYNLGTNVEYAIKMTDEIGEVSTVIKAGKSYLNRYGTTSSQDISGEEINEIIDNYSFEEITDDVLDVFSKAFFDASVIETSSENKVVLLCDPFAMVPDENADDYEEQEELIFSLQMLTSLRLELEYANKQITKLVGIFEDADGNISTTTIEFVSLEVQVIDAPQQ